MLVSLGTFCFIGGMLASKWVAIAPLATVSGVITAIWLLVECAILLVLRHIVEGSWRL